MPVDHSRRIFSMPVRGFCQVVETEMLIRYAGASPRAYPPLRRPAPCLSPRPNSRIAAASLCGTPARTADAVEGESVEPWGHTRARSAGHVLLPCTPAY